MPKLVECIPNFSEGRDRAVIDALSLAAQKVPGVTLLDVQADEGHNRSVLTLVGSPEGMEEAAVALAKAAAAHIDLRRHSGEHPRMGAVDVIPFVPVMDVTMEDCVELSRRAARRVWEEAHIPVFLYEESASAAHRVNLADVRRGQFEGMPAKLKLAEWAPDYGGREIHPTAGVVAVGARKPLVAFNVNLDTNNVEVAKEIAKVVRASSGGFRGIKALGLLPVPGGRAQVSMNVVDYEAAPLYRAVEVIRMEAARWGARVMGTELVGLTPAKALIDSAAYYLQLEGFDGRRQVLEYHLIGSGGGKHE